MKVMMKGLRFACVLQMIWSAGAAVQQEDTNPATAKGDLRYFYDDSASNACKEIIFVGVGTSMSREDYDDIATDMVSNSGTTVVVIVDHNPRFGVKLDETKFAAVVNDVMDNLSTVVPVCPSDPDFFVIGGHSAGGKAAFFAAPLLAQAPAAYLGLDPWPISAGGSQVLELASMTWSFSQETCSVDPATGSLELYRLSKSDARVLYRIDNPDEEIKHCSFTDHGCPFCRSNDADYPLVQSGVGESIPKFLTGIRQGFTKELFDFTPAGLSTTNYVNEEAPATGSGVLDDEDDNALYKAV